MNSKIKIENLSVSFPESGTNLKSLLVINDLSINVKQGEFITVIGPSGCGKTTLLKTIGGIKTKASVKGLIEIDGINPVDLKRKRKIGFAFQNPVLLPWRNVIQNVLLPLELGSKIGKKEIDSALSYLEVMGFSDFSESFPHELSGGMQQRVNLARALIHNPELLLMDEPFGSLDEITRLRLNFELLKMVNIKKQTSILITHSLREALLLGNKVIVLSKRPGTIVSIFEPSTNWVKEPGVETSSQFNIDLKELTNIFLMQEKVK